VRDQAAVALSCFSAISVIAILNLGGAIRDRAFNDTNADMGFLGPASSSAVDPSSGARARSKRFDRLAVGRSVFQKMSRVRRSQRVRCDLQQRPAPTRFMPFSYFCILLERDPRGLPQFVLAHPPIRFRLRPDFEAPT